MPPIHEASAELINKAKGLTPGVLAPLKEFTAKILQTVGIAYGTDLSESDKAAITQFYASRKKLANTLAQITEAQNISPTSAANDENIDQKKAA